MLPNKSRRWATFEQNWKAIGDPVLKFGPPAQPSHQWNLNCSSSDLKWCALTHWATPPPNNRRNLLIMPTMPLPLILEGFSFCGVLSFKCVLHNWGKAFYEEQLLKYFKKLQEKIIFIFHKGTWQLFQCKTFNSWVRREVFLNSETRFTIASIPSYMIH